jgi:Holliday junction resolvase RusA-like endonuclease
MPAQKRPKNKTYPITGIDLDNAQKAVFDALQGIVYLNDAQIVEIYATKTFCSEGQPPQIRMAIWQI